MTDNTMRFLGLIRRAGKLEIGDMAVVSSLKDETAEVILMASDSGANTVRKMRELAEKHERSLVMTPWDKRQLSHAIGRDNVTVAAVTDQGMAVSLIGKLASDYPDNQAYSCNRDRLTDRMEQIRTRKTNTRRK